LSHVFLIGIWATTSNLCPVKFFLYTMAGSVLMLVAIVYLYLRVAAEASTRQILSAIQSGRTPLTSLRIVLFLAFFLAFAIKVPLFRCTLVARTLT